MPFSKQSHIPTGLPALDADSTAHKQAVETFLIKQIEQAPWGFMPFEQWMNLALYAPALGYYASGNTKFGSDLPEGDFTTAPELTPMFGQVLSRQIAQILTASNSMNVLEFGAGSGALAAAIIPALRQLGIEPAYQILEVSPDLRARQQQRLSELGSNVIWLDQLPRDFSGCVIANEVLDAMPATLFRWGDDATIFELGVSLGLSRSDNDELSFRRRRTGGIDASLGHVHLDETDLDNDNASAGDRGAPFLLTERPAGAELQTTIAQRMPPLPEYQSEINLQAEAWVRQMGSWLKKGAALLIDYGFPQHEYYHPQRATGTLMCHFRHHAHSQPLIYAGLQDITTHVDFTAMADAALDAGLDVLGYTSQARFLMNAGLTELIGQLDPGNARDYAKAIGPVQKLISEAEMGELFKVLAIGRDIDEPLLGFASGDRRHRL
ncbi:MAG TPA: SAM-dependent methyltransferase [Eoetvoesiella sp.]